MTKNISAILVITILSLTGCSKEENNPVFAKQVLSSVEFQIFFSNFIDYTDVMSEALMNMSEENRNNFMSEVEVLNKSKQKKMYKELLEYSNSFS